MTVLPDYQGRPVRLTDERWHHIRLHPEMAGMASAIEETLRDPQLVIRSRSDPSALLCHRFYRRTIVGAKWLCVVVEYKEADAFVLTAYLTDKPKTGEQIWPKP